MMMAIGSTTRVITGTYTNQVQQAIDALVEMGEAAENANRHALSAWYGSVCQWVRECEREGEGFTLTLPDPDEAGDPLTVIQVDSKLCVGD